MRGVSRQVVLGLASIVLLVAGCAGSASPVTSKAPSASVRPTVSTLLRQNGAGDYMTERPFHATGDFEIDWSYDCSAVTTGHDWLILTVYRQTVPGTATLFDTITPGPADTSGVTLENQATTAGPTNGDFYLKVVSECAWNLVVKG